MKLGIIYARTSRDDDTNGESASDKVVGKQSIEVQIEKCQALAKRHNYKVIGVFSEKNISGRTYWSNCKIADMDSSYKEYVKNHIGKSNKQTRPELKKVIDLLPKIDVIICYEKTRLCRPYKTSMLELFLFQELHKNQVVIHQVSGGIITPSDSSQLLVSTIMSMVNDGQLQLSLKKAKDSLAKLKNEGWLICSPDFYGFKSGGHQKVIPIIEELSTVETIYELFLKKGYGITKICRYLNKLNIPSRGSRGRWKECSGKWNYNTVKRILKRVEYTGMQYNTYGQLIESKVFMAHKTIELNDWYSVRKKIKDKSKNPHRHSKTDHPLSGIIKCGYCHRHLHIFNASGSKEFNIGQTFYYHCRWRIFISIEDRNIGCSKSLVRESSASKPYLGKYENIGLLEALQPLTIFGYIRQLREKKMNFQWFNEKCSLENRLSEIIQFEEAMLQKLNKDIMDEEQFDSILKSNKTEKKELRAQLDNIKNKIATSQDIKFESTVIADSVMGNLDSSTYEDLIKKAVKLIQVYAYHIKVHLTNGKFFVLERIPIASSRALPKPVICFDKKMIDDNSKIIIKYLYKSSYDGDKTENIIYDNGTLQILTIGKNPAPYQYQKESGRSGVPDLPKEIIDPFGVNDEQSKRDSKDI